MTQSIASLIENLEAAPKIAVVGLGYVGLPLALELAKYFDVTGFDVKKSRLDSLLEGRDSNGELGDDAVSGSSCAFTGDLSDIKECNIYILTIPTPIDQDNQPDLRAVEAASKDIGGLLKYGDVVVYESTVYPGVTEDICGPILEAHSGLKSGQDFYLGYSPERINPGDTKNTVATITKIVAGQTPEICDFLAGLYGKINGNNIFKAANIKTAEAAKAIENAQRDINVAFINEVTMVLNKMGLRSCDVLEAARTKWNFLPFTPGLVGGHCIGVDPYYMAKCAMEHGHHPQMILAGRDINDSMGGFFAHQMSERIKPRSKILLLGLTFKENISDIRNTKVVDVLRALEELGHELTVHDPYADKAEVKSEYGLDLLQDLSAAHGKFDAIGLMVAHDAYKGMNADDIESLGADDGALIYDIKALWKQMDFSAHIKYRTL